MKKTIAIVLVTIILTFSVVCASSELQKVAAYINNNLKVTYNGEYFNPKEDNGTPIKPLVYNGRTYLPVRVIAELTGMEVDYDTKTNTVILEKIEENAGIPYKDGDGITNCPTYPPNPLPIPNPTPVVEYKPTYVTSSIVEGNIVLKWEPIRDTRLQGYKVVISKNNPQPKYPDDGYLYYITNKEQNTAIINNREPYKNGDFGQYLVEGQEYYVSITSMYDKVNIPSNVIRIKYQGKVIQPPTSTTYAVPKLSFQRVEDIIMLKWEPIRDTRLQGYKVVISKNNPQPKYPEDGYLYYITNKEQSYALLNNKEPYKNGDFGQYLEKGQHYYVSITAVYGDIKTTSNVIKIEY